MDNNITCFISVFRRKKCFCYLVPAFFPWLSAIECATLISTLIRVGFLLDLSTLSFRLASALHTPDWFQLFSKELNPLKRVYLYFTGEQINTHLVHEAANNLCFIKKPSYTLLNGYCCPLQFTTFL